MKSSFVYHGLAIAIAIIINIEIITVHNSIHWKMRMRVLTIVQIRKYFKGWLIVFNSNAFILFLFHEINADSNQGSNLGVLHYNLDKHWTTDLANVQVG